MAAGRLVAETNLSRDEIVQGLDALKQAQETARDLNLKTPKLDAAIKTLSDRLRHRPTRDPQNPPTGVTPMVRGAPGGGGKAPPNFVKPVVDKTQEVRNAVANAASIASRENSAQKAELGNIKNATTTLDATVRAQAVAQMATDVLQGSLQAARDAINTGAVRSGSDKTANAARGAGDRAAGATNAMSGAVTRAIWGAAAAYQTVIQPTTVIERHTVTIRGGETSDSRTRSGY
jgi:hypothetical protein